MKSLRVMLLEEVIISPELTLGEAMTRLDQAGSGALALCGPDRLLEGLLTDGDIRRAILRGVDLNAPCRQAATLDPIMVRPGVGRAEALHLMVQREIDQLPVVDNSGMLIDLLLRKDLVAAEQPEEEAVGPLDRVIVAPTQTLAEAIAQLDAAGTGALVLCTEDRKVQGLLSDGDIRRAILQGISLETPCGNIAKRDPFMVCHPLAQAEALRLMLERDINHLPVVDARGHLFDFLLRRDLAQETSLNMSAVIMAGGFGKRLMPLTEHVPKPMLPVGDKPLLERTIEKLRHAGVHDINLTTHYLPESIHRHFGDGTDFGVHINYAQEDHPLGTAGGLRLLPRPDKPFVVINGDILTGLSFETMLQFHRQHGALMTVGVRKYEVLVPYGVVQCDEVRITGLQEKPSFAFFINAGIYLLEPAAYDHIPSGERFDMTDLIQKLIESEKSVISFPIIEYWLDIGRPEDYQKALDDCRDNRI